MKANKRKKLESRGWKVGSAGDFLGLTDEERLLVELRLDLSNKARDRRIQLGVSQTELAARIGSSQSRVAKMESGDPSVSTDLVLRALFALDVSRSALAQVVAQVA